MIFFCEICCKYLVGLLNYVSVTVTNTILIVRVTVYCCVTYFCLFCLVYLLSYCLPPNYDSVTLSITVMESSLYHTVKDYRVQSIYSRRSKLLYRFCFCEASLRCSFSQWSAVSDSFTGECRRCLSTQSLAFLKECVGVFVLGAYLSPCLQVIIVIFLYVFFLT